MGLLFPRRPHYRFRTKIKFAQKGQCIDGNGYARYVDSNKLVHRYVAERYILGRKLLPNEEVHHKNRNKLDNRAGNLQVVTHGQHVVKHMVSKLLTGRK
jgi:hypothetical protein